MGREHQKEQCIAVDALFISGTPQADALVVARFLEGQTGLNSTTKLVVSGIGTGQVNVEQIAR